MKKDLESELLKNKDEKNYESYENSNEEKENTEIEEDDEEENIKKNLIPKFSNKDLFIKSTKISLKNWRKSLYVQIEFFVTQIFDIYLPILKANIIDSITSSNNYDEIFTKFKKYMSFLILKVFTQQFLEFLEYLYIIPESNKYKNILLERIIKKDISFFDLFKTGELIEKLEKCEDKIEDDFIFKII